MVSLSSWRVFIGYFLVSTVFEDNNSSWEHFQSGEWGWIPIVPLCCFLTCRERLFFWHRTVKGTLIKRPLPHCPAGSRGSYGDIGGPVITTQVTIPKDVSPPAPPHPTGTRNSLSLSPSASLPAGRFHHRQGRSEDQADPPRVRGVHQDRRATRGLWGPHHHHHRDTRPDPECPVPSAEQACAPVHPPLPVSRKMIFLRVLVSLSRSSVRQYSGRFF